MTQEKKFSPTGETNKENEKEKSLPCIEESNMPDKYNLERILKQYKSAWKKLAKL